jgi:DNA-binding response OmpR family regulator
VLVVDDEPKIVDVVSSYLERDGYTPLRAASGSEALRVYEASQPRLVILDLMLPDIPGEEVCRKLRARSRVPIIMLTAKVDDGDAVAGLGLGADDYVTKPFSPRELMARVQAVLRRHEAAAPLAGSLTFGEGDLVIDADNRAVRKRGSVVDLTAREYAILLALAASPGRIFPRGELVQRALGEDYAGYDRTIDAHVKDLRRKIETDPHHPRYIVTVHGMGYRFSSDPHP